MGSTAPPRQVTIPGRDAGDERRGRLSGGSGGYPGLHPFGDLRFYLLDLRHGGAVRGTAPGELGARVGVKTAGFWWRHALSAKMTRVLGAINKGQELQLLALTYRGAAP